MCLSAALCFFMLLRASERACEDLGVGSLESRRRDMERYLMVLDACVLIWMYTEPHRMYVYYIFERHKKKKKKNFIPRIRKIDFSSHHEFNIILL